MARHRLATNTDTRRSEDALATYPDVAAQLYGPRRRREAILAELRDGLEQATEDNIAAGLSPDQAATAAITQFGTPEPSATRSAANWPPPTPAAPSPGSSPPVRSWNLVAAPLQPSRRTGLIALLAAIPVLPLLIIAIATAGGTLATTGR